jgi:YD repeat-containing protein
MGALKLKTASGCRKDYNARGDLTGLTDALNNRTSFEYDPNGNVVARNRPSVVPDGNGGNTPVIERTVYSYDAEGHLIRQEAGTESSPKKAVTEWTYNPLGRMTSRKVLWHYTDGTPDEVQDESSFSYEPILEASLMKTANNGNALLSFTNELAPPFAQSGYGIAATQAGNPLRLIEDSFTLTRDNTGEIASIIRAKAQGNTRAGTALWGQMHLTLRGPDMRATDKGLITQACKTSRMLVLFRKAAIPSEM